MKTFAQYLVESEKTFSYRIKIVGDMPTGFISAFKDGLRKFDPIKVGEVKQTPIVSQHVQFPKYPNERVSMMDVEFKYPATPPQIAQLARLMGLDEDRIAINELGWQEGIDKELLGIADQKDLLTSPYPEPNREQRELKKDYSAAPMDHEVVRNSAKSATWTVAGGKTPSAETTNDLPMGNTSPMTKTKRPPRPATGRQPSGK